MGLGFVVGGFCPGTSVCAAAIGKIDAMIFVGGSFLGVFIFAEGYPLFENLYKAAPWGNVRVFDVLGMSQSLFAFLLTVVAVGAFWATTWIESKVNGKSNPEFNAKPLYYGLTGLALIMALSAFALPERRQSLLAEVNDSNFVNGYQVDAMDCDELAFNLVDKDKNLQIIDMRSQKEFDAMNLPNSTRLTLENLFEKNAHKLLTVRHKQNVFIANDEATEKKAAVLAKELGYSEIFILKGGLDQFRKDILNFTMTTAGTNQHERDTYRFRTKAAEVLPVLIQENKLKLAASGPQITKPKRVVGGC